MTRSVFCHVHSDSFTSFVKGGGNSKPPPGLEWVILVLMLPLCQWTQCCERLSLCLHNSFLPAEVVELLGSILLHLTPPPPSCQHMYISRLAGSLVGMRSSSLGGLLVDTCHASSRFTSFLCFLGLDVPQPTQLPPVDKNSLGSQFVCGHQQCCNKPLTV